MKSLVKINIFLLAVFLAGAAVFSNYVHHDSMTAMNETDGIDLPVLMYHSVLKDTDLSGQYVVTPSEVRADIDYLKANGYTTVSVENLVGYVEYGAPLPEKPIMLTFDDGCYNNYGYIAPMLEETDTCAVFCIVGEYTDEYSKNDVESLAYGYMRWKDLADLAKNPRVELANHSYGFHSYDKGRNGSKRNEGEDIDEYKEIFRADTQKNQDCFINNSGYEPYIYTYPFGAYSEESVDILKSMGFKAVLSCTEGINSITRDPDCLFLLKRYNRPSGILSTDVFAKFENTYSE